MKKILVCALVLAMIALVGVPALAADPKVAPTPFTDISGDDAEYELTVMAALGIMTGDLGLGGPVRPEATITRAEICKILVSALGYARMEPTMRALQPNFKDGAQIPPWAWGWVNIAQQLNLIGGYPDGSFKAGNTVTYAEVVAMLVRCVFGHDQQAKKSAMAWPMNYIGYAVMWGFTGEVTPFAQLPAIRGDVAKMIFATMQVNQVGTDGAERLNSYLLNGRIVTGALGSYSATTATIGTSSKALMDPYYLYGANSLDAMQYVDVTGILDKKTDGKWVLIKKVGTSSSATGLTYTGDTETSGSTTYLLFEGSKKIPFRNPTPVTLNNVGGHTEVDLQEGDICQVLQGGDQYALSITATRWDIGQDYLTDVDKSSGSTDTYITTQGKGGFSVPSAATVLVNRSNAGRDTLLANDVVRIATLGADHVAIYRIEANRVVVEGTVTSVSTSYTSGGTVIRVTINKTSGGSGTYVLDSSLPTPDEDSHVKYGLDADNKLYVLLALTETHPYVLIKEVEVGTTTTVRVDYRGTQQTYTVVGGIAGGDIGKFGLLTLNSSNKVTAFSEYSPGGTTYDVLTHSSANATVREDGNPTGTVKFIDNSNCYVYRWNSSSSSYTYIGTSGLVDGGHVQTDSLSTFWVYTP